MNVSLDRLHNAAWALRVMRSPDAETVELAINEIEFLRAWKEEALTVLGAWCDLTEDTWRALGKPPHLLGKRGVDVVREAFDPEIVRRIADAMTPDNHPSKRPGSNPNDWQWG